MTRGVTAEGAAGQLERPAGRLRASGDVRAVFDARRAAPSAVAVVHAKPRTDAGPARVTVVAGKRIGNAVQRNRVKRRLRAAVRQAALRPGCDYVVIGRAAALTARWDDVQAAVARAAAAVDTRP